MSCSATSSPARLGLKIAFSESGNPITPQRHGICRSSLVDVWVSRQVPLREIRAEQRRGRILALLHWRCREPSRPRLKWTVIGSAFGARFLRRQQTRRDLVAPVECLVATRSSQVRISLVLRVTRGPLLHQSHATQGRSFSGRSRRVFLTIGDARRDAAVEDPRCCRVEAGVWPYFMCYPRRFLVARRYSSLPAAMRSTRTWALRSGRSASVLAVFSACCSTLRAGCSCCHPGDQ